MASEPQRSREARELAEHALVEFLISLGEHRHKVVVIGGLNPDYLTEAPPAPHLGTTDVDLLLEVGLIFDRAEADDFSWLEPALRAAGFTPATSARAWRWQRRRNGVPVTIDILCDVPDNLGQEIVLPACDNVTAMNLSGPAAVLQDAQLRMLMVPPSVRTDEIGDHIEARFAGLGGYILAKASAAARRQQVKDYYDLAFVLLYNVNGSPAAAAQAVIDALPNPSYTDHVADLRAALGQYSDVDAVAPRAFAGQIGLSGATADTDILAQDAVSAAREFLAEFDRLRMSK